MTSTGQRNTLPFETEVDCGATTTACGVSLRQRRVPGSSSFKKIPIVATSWWLARFGFCDGSRRLDCSSGRRARAWIYFIHYNFVRIHQTLKITPAMAANVTANSGKGPILVKVLEDWEAANYGARPC